MSTAAITDALTEQARAGDAISHPFFLEDKNGLRVYGSLQDFYKAEPILYSEPDNLFRTHDLSNFVKGAELLELFQDRFAKLRGKK
jgi:hypothetical protein